MRELLLRLDFGVWNVDLDCCFDLIFALNLDSSCASRLLAWTLAATPEVTTTSEKPLLKNFNA